MPSPSSSPPAPSAAPGDDGTFPGTNTTLPEDPARRAVHLRTADGTQIQFRDIIAQGALCPSSTRAGAFVGCGGFERRWDACSATPWLRSAQAGQIVTYDDGDSLVLKAALARQRGILGTNMFDVSGDTDAWVLTDAVRRGLGLVA